MKTSHDNNNNIIYCTDPTCHSQIKYNSHTKYECKICLLPFCSEVCLISHISLTHQEKKVSINNGHLIPQASLYQSNSFYDIGNFEKVKINTQIKILGSGAFGSVYLVRHKQNGAYYALKQMNKQTLKNMIDYSIIHREFNIHIMLSHENICKLYAYREDDENFYMIMEYESNGNLFSEIQKHKKGLNEDKAYEYFIQICNAILFLHSHGIIHRDIKPENCLLDMNKNIKLCDFGWTTRVSSQLRTTFCGTFEYMAPEIIQEHPYSKSVDIWSLGILLYEMLHGYSPFRGNGNAKEIMKNILKGKFQFKKESLSNEVQSLINELLDPNENKRITIEKVYLHPWIKKYNSITSSGCKDTMTNDTSLFSYNNDLLFDSVLNQISKKKTKAISPINEKPDVNESLSLYKEIKEIETVIDNKVNEISNFKQKAEKILKKANNKCNNDKSEPIIAYNFNDSIIVRRKENKKQKKRKVYSSHRINNINITQLTEISTQTEINTSENNKSLWNIFSIFKCGGK